jgi:hypothetical protein
MSKIHKRLCKLSKSYPHPTTSRPAIGPIVVGGDERSRAIFPFDLSCANVGKKPLLM